VFKVLRILNRFNLGGPTYNAAYLSRYLSNDFETRLIGGEKDPSEGSSLYMTENLGLKPEVIKGMKREISPVNDYRSYRKIRSIIQEYRPQIVHTHASKAGAIGRLAAIHERVPIIVHTYHGHVFHSYFGRMKSGFYRSIESWLGKRSDAIVAISDLQKQEICEEYGVVDADKTTVIPLGFDLNRFTVNREENRKAFRSRFELSDDIIAIGIIGRLVPVKDHHLFLKAAKEVLAKTNQPVRFFIIGDGESRQDLEFFADQLNLSRGTPDDPHHDVVFTSWMREAELALAGLDIVCLTSKNEGTPVSLIEAQAAAKPVVSTRAGGIENVVLAGESALLSDVGDENAFAINLTQLINHPDQRSGMAGKAQDFVMQRFNYTRLCEDTESLYRQLLRTKGLTLSKV
jgi:glycosyltransferase involved in cell wall biosynthesis